MTLTDAGPLVALIDADEEDHERCRSALDEITLPMLTTWPAFTEAMYLLGRAAGWLAQEKLWRLLHRQDVIIDHLADEDLARSMALMHKYADTPMDLADATLIAVAERRDLRRIFTLDGDFRVYRLRNRRALELIPR